MTHILKKQPYTTIAAIIGLVLFAVSLLISPVFLPIPQERHSINIVENWMTMSNVSAWQSDAIEIRYPSRLIVTDSDIVEVMWTPRGPGHFLFKKFLSPKNESELGDILFSKEMTLSGGAFIVKPKETLTSTLEKGESFSTWTWSITPKKEGDQKLLLDLQDLQIRLLRGDHYATIKRNNEEAEIISKPGINNVVLPIEILTKEGLSLRSYLIIKYTIMVFGAVLVCPAISNLLTRVLTKRKDKLKADDGPKPDSEQGH